MTRPDWLPPQLLLNGSSYQDDINTLYAIYERDFIVAAPTIVDGSSVIVNDRLDPNWDREYTYGFTHTITRGEEHRGIDYDRAKKLPWIRAILDNYAEPEVTAFWYSQPRRDGLYLWMQDHDFVVILTPQVGKRAMSLSDRIIVTAYSVGSHRRHDFERMLSRALRVL